MSSIIISKNQLIILLAISVILVGTDVTVQCCLPPPPPPWLVPWYLVLHFGALVVSIWAFVTRRAVDR
jgi:hypothetical protein